jgi:tRNA-dihydrouridine synthase
LVSNAINKYVSRLTGDDRISLSGTSFQKLKDNLLRSSSRFGYDYLIKVVNTVRTVDAAGDATYSDPINMLERYLDDNVVLARKHLHSPAVIAALPSWQRIPLKVSLQLMDLKLQEVH